MKCFSKEIKDLRLENKFTVLKVATCLGIDPTTLSKIEKGEREVSRKMIPKLAELFGLDEDDLFTSYYGDQVAKIIYKQKNCENILKFAKEKIKYIKKQSPENGKLTFYNE